MISLLLLAPLAAAAAFFCWLVWQSSYWSRRGIRSVPGHLFYGSSKELLNIKKPRVTVYQKWTALYGKTFGIKEGAQNTLVTSDLAMVQELFAKQFDNFYSRKATVVGSNVDKDPRATLFTSRGARWKRLRAISAPSFSVNVLKKIRPVVEESVRNMLSIIEERHADEQPFNIHELYMEYTMDTIGRLVLGQKESKYFANPRVEVAKAHFMRDLDSLVIHISNVLPFLGSPAFYLVRKAGGKLSRSITQLMGEMEAVVMERVRMREQNPDGASDDGGQDFLDIFLDTAAENVHDNTHFNLSKSAVEKAMTVDEVIAQAVVFLLAGFDTTANALGYTSWMLSKHPEVLAACQAEVDEVCTEEDISYEDLTNLRYLEATCKETLRFYPLAAFANSRTCMVTSDVCGVEIEAGTHVQVDTFSLHFDPDIWGEDAREFKPERWLDSSRRVHPMAYLPFGAGPRICIGMRLALLEEKLALAHILRKFDILEGTKDELVLLGSLTLTPEAVPVRIAPRQ